MESIRAQKGRDMRQWLTPRSEELYCFYAPNIVWVIKSGRTRWVWRVALVWGEEMCMLGFGGETSGKEPTWEDNIKTFL